MHRGLSYIMKECMNYLPKDDYNQLTSKFGQIVGKDVQIKPDYVSLKKISEEERD